jgi:hypothetical protein
VDVRNEKSCHVCNPDRIYPNPINLHQRLQIFRTKPSPLAIAATCQKFYHEVVKIWYGNVRFFFQCELCMTLFLEEIGDSNRDTIRHVGYFAFWGSETQTTESIFHTVSSLASLKSLTFEETWRWENAKEVEVHQDLINIYLDEWKEANHLLMIWDRLESVVLTNWILRYQDNEEYPSRLISHSRALKVQTGTAERVIGTDVVEIDVKEDLPEKNGGMKAPSEFERWIRCVRFADSSRMYD